MTRPPLPLRGVCFTCRLSIAPPRPASFTPVRSYSAEVQTGGIIPPAEPPPPPPPARLDPRTVTRPRDERRLLRSRIFPVGSRRRRAALKTSQNIPFEQLPYQCFQEARKVLQEDRQQKLDAIETERDRIRHVAQQKVNGEYEEWKRQNRLRSMRRQLEWLKIQADINDPLVKKRFEDGFGDMARPIYRHLAERKWRTPGGRYLITDQRIRQMHVVPDVIPAIELKADVSISFHGTKPFKSKVLVPRENPRSGLGGRVPVQPGEFVASAVSEHPPKVEIQVFDKGTRLVTVAVVDPDVPNLETDGFEYRCHFLACNIPISPTEGTIRLYQLSKEQIVQAWSPPYAQKGSPYHRLAVLVFQQTAKLEEPKKPKKPSPSEKAAVDGKGSAEQQGKVEAEVVDLQETPQADNTQELPVKEVPAPPSPLTMARIDVEAAKQKYTQDGFVMKSFAARHALEPIGAHLFRTQWDGWMDGVMTRLGVPGVGEELKRKRSEKSPYKNDRAARARG